jgi:hypothetical protein
MLYLFLFYCTAFVVYWYHQLRACAIETHGELMGTTYNGVSLRENTYSLVWNGTLNQYHYGKTQTSNNFAVCQRTDTSTGDIV